MPAVAAPPESEAAQPALDELLWVARPLVVFADTPDDPRFVQQLGMLQERMAELEEREVVILTDRDLVSVPPGVYREEINIGEEDALMCVMLGAQKPITPTYPPEHPLSKIKR